MNTEYEGKHNLRIETVDGSPLHKTANKLEHAPNGYFWEALVTGWQQETDVDLNLDAEAQGLNAIGAENDIAAWRKHMLSIANDANTFT